MITKTKWYFNLIGCICFSLSWLVSGCDSSAKTDALIGQAVGGDTGATLVGAVRCCSAGQ